MFHHKSLPERAFTSWELEPGLRAYLNDKDFDAEDASLPLAPPLRHAMRGIEASFLMSKSLSLLIKFNCLPSTRSLITATGIPVHLWILFSHNDIASLSLTMNHVDFPAKVLTKIGNFWKSKPPKSLFNEMEFRIWKQRILLRKATQEIWNKLGNQFYLGSCVKHFASDPTPLMKSSDRHFDKHFAGKLPTQVFITL